MDEKKINEFFDENSRKWIEYYKIFAMVILGLDILGSAILAIMGWSDWFWITGSPFLDGVILLVGGLFIAVVTLLMNMVVLQLINNVQIIREKLEKE